MSVIISALVISILGITVQGQTIVQEIKCPARCLCFRTTVRCMFLQMDKIPPIPPGTTVLDMRFNKIREILPNSLKELKHLNTLLLNNNNILRLENGAFNGLGELKYLYLYKNRIKDVDPKVFHGLYNLEQLYLHFNKIEKLPTGIFETVKKLDRLFLHNNKLQRISSGAFKNLDGIKRLRLDSNALICDCQLIWLAKLLLEKGEDTQAAVTCLHPLPMKGKSVTQLLEDEEFHCKKPQLSEEPTDIEVTFGKTAYLICKADGDPHPDIIWLRNNNEIDFESDPRLQMLDDGTLMIESATSDDFGTYECMAKSPLGEVKSRTVRMTQPQDHKRAAARPRFVYPPREISVNVGEIAIFRCEVSGFPRPSVSWFLNDVQVTTTERTEVRADGNLEIRDVIAEDAGNYRCTAVNSLGRASSVARLIVQAAPRILEPPGTQSAWEGSGVEFNCYVDGQPVPTIIWLKDDTPLTAEGRVSMFVGGTKLRIQQVQKSDQGRYKCRVENVAGVASSEAELFVFQSTEGKRAPRLTKIPNPIETRRLGASLELRCEAEGLPNPTVVWRKDGVTIAPNPQKRILVGGYLSVHSLTRNDAGSYECMALNEVGHITARVLVSLSDVSRGPSYTDVSYIHTAVDDARQTVNQAIEDTLQIVYNRHSTNSSSHHGGHGDLLRSNRFPNANARAIALSAEVYDTALENVRNFIRRVGNMTFNTTDFNYIEAISRDELDLLANLSGCRTHRSQPDCSDWCFHSKYRTHDGSCNNMAKPMMGSSYTAFKRLLPNAYEDGFNQPVGYSKSRLYSGFQKPSARLVSTRVITSRKTTEDEKYTHMLMQWGQFLDHDMDLAVPGIAFESFSNRIDCRTSCEQSNPCFPIDVPPGDPRIRSTNCMEFTRNSAVCGSGESSAIYPRLLPREQINQQTSYIDASMIYGSTEEESQQVRDLPSNRGMLRIGLVGPAGKPFLPFASERQHVDCKRDRRESNLNCFLAGDVRANEQTGLLVMHTLWFREHNRIATELRRINRHWDGDMLYHETRKIVGAMIQHITYSHWLPHIIGDKGMKWLGDYKGYNPEVDPSIANVFATAALRMGHGLINPVLQRLNSSFLPIPEGNLPLHKAFFAPWRIVEEGGIDPILRGLFAGPAKIRLSDQLLNSDLTEQLFRPAHLVAQDLASLNIQRGRDHGLPSYNDWRKFCGLAVAENFYELREEIKSLSLREKLHQLYGHPGNVDIWVGAMAEDPVDGAKVGPTFQCLLADQFKRLRDGDRFWYENPGVFKPEQLVQIRQARLSKVICDSSDEIREVTKDVFYLPDGEASKIVQCDAVLGMDLRFWTECCSDCENSGQFNTISRQPANRLRRSVEPPMANDSEYDNLSNSSNTVSESQSSGKLSDKTSGKPSKLTTPSKLVEEDLMDIGEERIEGLESVIAQMHNLIRKLNKKIEILESKCSKNISHKHECLESNGGARKNGERWESEDCEDCLCKEGGVKCVKIFCPITDCENPVMSQGSCCPVCVG